MSNTPMRARTKDTQTKLHLNEQLAILAQIAKGPTKNDTQPAKLKFRNGPPKTDTT